MPDLRRGMPPAIPRYSHLTQAMEIALNTITARDFDTGQREAINNISDTLIEEQAATATALDTILRDEITIDYTAYTDALRDALADTTGGSLVGFIQDGTGAVVRTIQAKFKDVISSKDFGVVGDGITNDTDALVNALQAAADQGVMLRIARGTILVDHMDEAFNDSLYVVMDPGAVIKGTLSYQHYAGTGAVMAVNITDFDYYEAGINVETVTAAAVSTELVVDVDYTIVGNLVTTINPVALGDTLRISSTKALLTLRGLPAKQGSNTPNITWMGGKFDTSDRGFSLANASGSALTLHNWRLPHIQGTAFYSGEDYLESRATGIGGDSGITTLGCLGVSVIGCFFQGMADLGIYHTGGALSGDPTDDGGPLMVSQCNFYRCSTGLKSVRESPGAMVVGNYFDECMTGVLGGWTGTIGSGSDYIVSSNIFRRIERRCVDIRDMESGATIVNNRFLDWGYKHDDTVSSFGAGQAAVFVSGCPRSIVDSNHYEFIDWDGSASRGVHVNTATETGLTPVAVNVRNSVFINMQNAVVESGTAANFNGCRYAENRVIDVTTPYSLLGANTVWHYIEEDGEEARGRGTTVHAASPVSGTWTPTLINTTNITSSTPYTCNYCRVGNVVTFSGKMSITATANSAVTEIRMSVPVDVTFTADEQAGGTTSPGSTTGAGSPGSIHALSSGTQDQLRIRYFSGTASAGTSRDWHFSGAYLIP